MYLLAAQREVHLVDVVLVEGAEAGGATVLAVLAALITRSVFREGDVEDGSVEHNSAILSNLRVALKRMGSAGARVASGLLLAHKIQELRCVDHIAHKDALAPLLNLEVPVEPPDGEGERLEVSRLNLLIVEAREHTVLVKDEGDGRRE